MGEVDHGSRTESDLELNRGLCAYLLERLKLTLNYLEVLPEEAALPGWIDRLFGGKEGLVGAYIRLSQQQLRIAVVQAEAEKGMGIPGCDNILTKNDVALARAALERWEAQEKEKEDEA